MRVGVSLAAALLGWCPSLPAQWFAVGIKGGLRATDDLTIALEPGSDESKRYIAGPMLDVRLPLRLGVEFDALYSRFGYTLDYSYLLTVETIRARANSWEFPIIVKYRPPFAGVHPYVGIGYAPRVVHGSEIDSGYYYSPNMQSITPFRSSYPDSYPTTHGLVVSGGIDVDVKRLRIAPELRYVHWVEPFLSQYPDGIYRLQSAQNEVFILVGLAWHR
jgi:hypothetical protein